MADFTPSVTVTSITAGGTTGNGFTLANSSGTAAITRSAATLTGGSNTVGGIALATNVLGEWDARYFPQIKGDIYVVSTTTAAKISTTYGQP